MNNQNHLEGYVSIEGINTLDDLVTKIQKEVSVAFGEFAKDNKLPIVEPKIEVQQINNGQSNLLYLRPKKIPKQKLGTMGNCLERADLTFFSGRRIEYIMYQGKLWFNPFVWMTLNVSITLKRNGGQNGMPYYVGSGSAESNSIYYDIPEGKFYTETEKHDVVRERARAEKRAAELAEQERRKQLEDE
jgi:hypothetical protein